MISLLFLSLVSAASVDAVAPPEVCRRFINPTEQKNCLETVKGSSVDAYLAPICEKQFEDDGFYECLKLSKDYKFDPTKIEKCSADELEDRDRVDCLKTAGQKWVKPGPAAAPAYLGKGETRKPASKKSAKKKKKHHKRKKHAHS